MLSPSFALTFTHTHTHTHAHTPHTHTHLHACTNTHVHTCMPVHTFGDLYAVCVQIEEMREESPSLVAPAALNALDHFRRPSASPAESEGMHACITLYNH